MLNDSNGSNKCSVSTPAETAEQVPEIADAEDYVFELDDLIAPPCQDPRRVANVKGLMTDIRLTGYVAPPLVAEVDGEDWILSGNRRCAALRLLGVTEVTCHFLGVITRKRAIEIYTRLDADSRRQTAGNAMYGWAALPAKERQHFLKTISPSARGHIHDLIDVFGEARALELAADAAPTFAHRVIALHSRMVRTEVAIDKAVIGEWMIKHRMTGLYDALKKMGYFEQGKIRSRLEKLATLIRADVPVRITTEGKLASADKTARTRKHRALP